MTRSSAIVSWGVLASFAAASHGGSISIVVNIGSYPTAADAAGDEANVRWDDGDDTDDIICTECFAAVELQRYLRKMAAPAGQDDYEIVDDDQVPAEGQLIRIGNPRTNKTVELPATDFEGLGPEGYMIRCFARVKFPGTINLRPSMSIGGEGRIGTLYGVYRFLEFLGVRWLSPGTIGEEIPRSPLKVVGFSADGPIIREKPAFITRGFHAWEDRADADFFDWMARNRMNYWCVDSKDHAALKKRGIQMNCGGHVLQSLFINPIAGYPYKHSKLSGNENLPADPYPVSPEYRGDADGDGKLSYSEAHPEWYGLRGGKRSFNIKGDFGDNFCSSNRDACNEFMKNLVQDLIDGRWRDADSVNFWTLDVGKWCECDNCKALGTPTDRNLLLVHRLRQEMKKAMAEHRLNRNVRIYFLAYADVLDPPTRPLPADFDYENCIATFFPIARCYVHTFADPVCTEFNAPYHKRLLSWFVDPARFYRGQVFIGEYYNVSGYKCLPIVFARIMAVDIPHYYENGARHMHYMHCTTKHWGTKSLTNCQLARMLWDPRLDVPAFLKDYYAKRYGPAAEVMERLYGRLDQALSNVTMLKYRLNRRLDANEKDLFPDKHLKYEAADSDPQAGPNLTEQVKAIDDCLHLLQEARAMSLPDRIRERIDEDTGPIQYAANTLHFFDVLVRATQLMNLGRRGEAAVLLPDIERLSLALRRDTTSTIWSSSHASAPNGLEAARVTGAYKRLLSELRPQTRPAESPTR